MTASVDPIVVLGSGLAGWTTVSELRKLDPAVPVTVVTDDDGDFYAKPSLSNAFAQGKRPEQLVSTSATKMSESLNVTLLRRTRVESIERAARAVVTDRSRIAYSKLVLATGAQPLRIPLAGNAAGEVLSVNSLHDFSVLHARLRPGSRVAIMGAGLIGCEFANDLAGAGYPVSVIDPSPRPLAALLPEQASQALRQALQALGIAWRLGTTVQSVDRNAGPLRLQLANGDGCDADVVLSAIGLRADMALARAAGLDCERGIVVNDALATSDPSIFALGDCAQYAGGRCLPYVLPIMSAARVLAARLTGRGAVLSFPLMPVSVKTPALPLVVAPPAPWTGGQWHASEEGRWHFLDDTGLQRGFVLAGRQTSRRAELAQRTAAG